MSKPDIEPEPAPRRRMGQEHPTIAQARAATPLGDPVNLSSDWLHALCVECGADDAGFVNMDHPDIQDQRADILASFPRASALISFVCRMNPHSIRSPLRSVANSEFHHTGRHVDEVGRAIARRLIELGVAAMNEPMAFPQEFAEFPAKKGWIVSHKPVAVAAGLGKMGIHRNVIHPKFGNHILLGTVVVDREIEGAKRELEYNPCLECKLCVAACPVGAISPDGYFSFSACQTHNYREFLGGFVDWVDGIVTSGSMNEYRDRFNDGETVSMWQSLSYGPSYKAAYCIAVCPAGEDVIGPFLADRIEYVREVVRPLQEKVETIYVGAGSDAKRYVETRFPHKIPKVVKGGIAPNTAESIFFGLKLLFQRGNAKNVSGVFQFTLTGREPLVRTVTIARANLEISEGLVGKPDVSIFADSDTLVGLLARRRNPFLALAGGKVRIKGKVRLMRDFQRCFQV